MDNRIGTTAEGEQYLTFSLGKEEYGIEILRVQEIKGYSAITPIPRAPNYIRGVMNLRGAVIPVIDLRVKFAMDATVYDKFTVIIVVKVKGKVVGVVVDAVSDVLEIAPGKIGERPELGSSIDASFIKGMAHLEDDRLAVLIDIDRLLSEDDIVFDAVSADSKRQSLLASVN